MRRVIPVLEMTDVRWVRWEEKFKDSVDEECGEAKTRGQLARSQGADEKRTNQALTYSLLLKMRNGSELEGVSGSECHPVFGPFTTALCESAC